MEILKKLSTDWENVKEIVIFGWGKYGQKLIKSVQKDFQIIAIIDNDESKNGDKYDGIPIMSMKEAICFIKNYKIVVMTHNKAYEDISKMLIAIDLLEYRDFCKAEHFVVEWYWRFKNQVNIFEVHTSVTTRCTLKCLNCNMFMPYYAEPCDIPYEQITKELDILFENVDYIYNYELLGGEPFLNKELKKILIYMCEKYDNKIGQVGIITNGTIIPDKSIWEILKKYKIHLLVSDYTSVVPYKEQLENFVSYIKKYDIQHKILKNLEWLDFGFPKNPCNYKDVRQHMLCCGPVFHGYNDGKLYYCHVSWSAEKCRLIQLNDTDFINLSVLSKEGAINKQELAQYSLGEWKKGYVSMCRLCGGCGKDNRNVIPAGIQKEGK